MKRHHMMLIAVLLGANAACGRTSTEPAADAGPAYDGFPRVSLGGAHSCSLDGEGRVRCWGDNAATSFKPPDERFKDISVSGADACGLRADGSLHCWPETTNYPTVESVPPGLKFRKVSVGSGFACGILSDGRLTCWGNPSEGVTDAPKGQFLDVSSGSSHVCALRSDSSAVCWGDNAHGQASPPEGLFIAISATYRHSCGLRENGLVVCWGDSKLFDRFKEKLARSVVVGLDGTCVLTLTGSVECDSDPSLFEIHDPAGRFEQIDMGDYHGCGVRRDGSIACWGANSDGQASPPG